MKIAFLILVFLLSVGANAQTFKRELHTAERAQISIENRFGRVRVSAEEAASENQKPQILLEADSPKGAVEEKDLTFKTGKNGLEISVNETGKRIDLSVRVPVRSRVKIEGTNGEIEISGNFESAEVATYTGTIFADVPTDSLKFNFLWTESRPRYLSDFEIPAPKEKAGGKFSIEGKFPSESSSSLVLSPSPTPNESSEEKINNENTKTDKNKKTKDKGQRTKDEQISLKFVTKRGVILLNVPPSEVPSDLRERPLTEAAKAVVRSGDSILSEAIRRASPKYFGDYLKTLPPRRRSPNLILSENGGDKSAHVDALRRVNVSVTDKSGRAINGLKSGDFILLENGEQREIVSVEPTSAPFNLVLLLDVSGSVEERIDFIRKAARNFINTVSPQDRLAVITFRDDVQVLSNFTTNKRILSESLDTFDAGGATALYDSLAYTLAETLRPLRGERTAIVILSDGDDNRSFIPFEPLLGAIQESGALVYPLYIPSGLIPTNSQPNPNQALDPLRTRYLTLTTKAEAEAKKLAEVSGGAYFPISRLEDLQNAYNDVVAQLRTAYSITYRSKVASPRLRVSVKQPGAFVRAGSPSAIPQLKTQPAGEQSNRQPETNFLFQNTAFKQDSNVTGEVKAINYKPLTTEKLREFPLENLDVNRAPPAFVAANEKAKFAVSRWVSPKRTRSYPYERVYNTLAHAKRAAVIPIVKDEGAAGDRDFLQWDTFSLMNLLEVYVVLGYYDGATKSPRRENALVEQKFNNEFVLTKLKEIAATKLPPYEWNLRELKNLPNTIEKVRAAYQKISETMGVRLHDESGLLNFEKNLSGDAMQFLEFSRAKSQKAQTREVQTDQPKETMPTRTKSRITISDYLGGKYFFTVDEAVYENGTLFLIESKHNQGGKLTNVSDIKDGLIKMIVYRNLVDVRRGGKLVKFMPVLRLTASEMQGAITSENSPEEFAKFVEQNRFDRRQIELLSSLFAEARANNFLIKLERASTK